MRFPQRSSPFLLETARGPRHRIYRFVVLGAVAGLTVAGVAEVGSLGRHMPAGETVAVQQQAEATGLLDRPLGTAFGQRSQAETDLGDGTKLAAWELKDGVKEFHLTAAPLTWQTEPGRTKQALAFNGQIPGPVIRVNQNDRVRIVVKNDMPRPTAVHWHGMELPNDQDGVPMLTQPDIEPGQTFTYQWQAVSTGTHWYHSHMDGDQEGRGLYGALEVVPTLGDFPAERDYRIMTGDGALGFVFNGKSYPASATLAAQVGDRVHIRVIGTGPEMFHAIHIHGGYFTVVAQDGRPLAVPQQMDTLNVGVGQSFDLIWVPVRPGKWMIHCHVFSHSEVAMGMTGMVSIANVTPRTVPLPSLPGITQEDPTHG
jgi:FtsP/CotA-like multicopper oxidase with cupredoxin domain